MGLRFYRSYLTHPNLGLPLTTNAVESMCRLLREMFRSSRAGSNPASVLLWATALIRLRHQVGDVARTLHAQAAVESGRSVEFETQYVHDHVLIRADIIERGGLFDFGPSTTRLVEVKSSSKGEMLDLVPNWDYLARREGDRRLDTEGFLAE